MKRIRIRGVIHINIEQTTMQGLVVDYIRNNDMDSLSKLIEGGLTKEQYLALCGPVNMLCEGFIDVTKEELNKLLKRTHLLLVQNDWGDIYTEGAINEIYFTLVYNNIGWEQDYGEGSLFNTKLIQKINKTVIKYYRDDYEKSAFHILQRILINIDLLKNVKLYSNTQEMESDAVWIIDDDTLNDCWRDMNAEDFYYAQQLFEFALGVANLGGEFNDFFIQGLLNAQRLTLDYIKQHTRKGLLDER